MGLYYYRSRSIWANCLSLAVVVSLTVVLRRCVWAEAPGPKATCLSISALLVGICNLQSIFKDGLWWLCRFEKKHVCRKQDLRNCIALHLQTGHPLACSLGTYDTTPKRNAFARLCPSSRALFLEDGLSGVAGVASTNKAWTFRGHEFLYIWPQQLHLSPFQAPIPSHFSARSQVSCPCHWSRQSPWTSWTASTACCHRASAWQLAVEVPRADDFFVCVVADLAIKHGKTTYKSVSKLNIMPIIYHEMSKSTSRTNGFAVVPRLEALAPDLRCSMTRVVASSKSNAVSLPGIGELPVGGVLPKMA